MGGRFTRARMTCAGSGATLEGWIANAGGPGVAGRCHPLLDDINFESFLDVVTDRPAGRGTWHLAEKTADRAVLRDTTGAQDVVIERRAADPGSGTRKLWDLRGHDWPLDLLSAVPTLEKLTLATGGPVVEGWICWDVEDGEFLHPMLDDENLRIALDALVPSGRFCTGRDTLLIPGGGEVADVVLTRGLLSTDERHDRRLWDFHQADFPFVLARPTVRVPAVGTVRENGEFRCYRRELEQLGFRIHEVARGSDFVDVELPEDWSVRPSRSTALNAADILDARGRLRGRFVNEPPDEYIRPFLVLHERYGAQIRFDSERTQMRAVAMDRGQGPEAVDIHEGRWVPYRAEIDEWMKLTEEEDAWVRERYPSAADVLAYWDEPAESGR